MKKIIKRRSVQKDHYIFEGSLDTIISDLHELKDSLPENSNPEFDICIGSYYGDNTIEVTLYYSEEETDAEFEKRRSDARKARAAKKAQKELDAVKRRALYEQLKKEFE